MQVSDFSVQSTEDADLDSSALDYSTEACRVRLLKSLGAAENLGFVDTLQALEDALRTLEAEMPMAMH